MRNDNGPNQIRCPLAWFSFLLYASSPSPAILSVLIFINAELNKYIQRYLWCVLDARTDRTEASWSSIIYVPLQSDVHFVFEDQPLRVVFFSLVSSLHGPALRRAPQHTMFWCERGYEHQLRNARRSSMAPETRAYAGEWAVIKSMCDGIWLQSVGECQTERIWVSATEKNHA